MNTPTEIETVFAKLRTAEQMAFMPFITAGDPDMAGTVEVIRELTRQGVDLIEIGFPYSDPIADGPVIQAAYTRALDQGLRIDDIFDAISQMDLENDVSEGSTAPALVAMVSYAIVLRRGPDAFVQRAKESGFAGFIIPDLPADEADDVREIVSAAGLDLIPLVSPTTTAERAEAILANASGFVYCISVAGTTGVRNELPTELTAQLKRLRSSTNVPLAVGFGISRPDQVGTLRGSADGIIVGSAIVRRMEPLANASQDNSKALADIGLFAAEMVAATHNPT